MLQRIKLSFDFMDSLLHLYFSIEFWRYRRLRLMKFFSLEGYESIRCFQRTENYFQVLLQDKRTPVIDFVQFTTRQQ